MRIELFRLMADYNRWMNRNLYDCAAELTAEELERDRGAFFGSISGTLEHLVVTDLLWLKRFRLHPTGAPLAVLDAVEAPKTLDETMFADFAEMRARRQELDDLIVAWIGGLGDDDLAGDLTYRRMNGDTHAKAYAPTLLHFFNHQTHHRGQVTTLLFQAGVDPGVTDLVVRVPEAPHVNA
jgi:uncharacterized damage-inducible protein DinB